MFDRLPYVTSLYRLDGQAEPFLIAAASPLDEGT